MVTSKNSKFISQSSGLIPIRKYFRLSAYSPYHHLTILFSFCPFCAQLSYAVRFALYDWVPANVINQVCQPDVECCALDSDRTHSDPMHRGCHESKYMFNVTSDFRFSSVVLLLFLCQRSRAEFHRKALTEPCVKLSFHTALRIPVKVSNRESNVRTYWTLFLQVYEAKP